MDGKMKLNGFDWFLILGTTAVSIASSLLGEGWDTLGFIVAVTGIVNLVLCARGNIWNYLFGIIYNAIYVYIAWHTKLYADSAIYLCYYLPMQFVPLRRWVRRWLRTSPTVPSSPCSSLWWLSSSTSSSASATWPSL